MAIGDSKLDKIRQRLFIPASQMAIETAAGPVLQSPGTGVAPYAEISTLGPTAFNMSAGDMCHYILPIPDNWNLEQIVRARVVFATASTDTADTLTWIVLYTAMTANVTAIAAPATALDPAISVDTAAGVAYAIQNTEWGEIAASLLRDKDFLNLRVELDAVGAGLAEAVYLLGLEIDYVPRISDKQSTMPPKVNPS